MKWLDGVTLVRRLMRRWQGPPRVVRLAADPAEMGTAYGLEASLAPYDDEAATPQGRQAQTAASAHGWLRPR